MNKVRLFLLSVLIICLSVLLSIIVWQSPDRGKTFIETLRLFLSWPVIVFVITATVIMKFPDEIGRLIDRIIKLPGGTELEPTQPVSGKGEVEEEDLTNSLIEQMEELEGEIQRREAERQEILNSTSDLIKELEIVQSEKVRSEELITEQVDKKRAVEEELKKTASERDMLKELSSKIIDGLMTETRYWKFQYLSMFLIPNTQNVLRWFKNLEMTNSFSSLNSFHTLWKSIIQSENERNTILEVLLNFDLLKTEGGNIKITETGKQFLNHIDVKQG